MNHNDDDDDDDITNNKIILIIVFPWIIDGGNYLRDSDYFKYFCFRGWGRLFEGGN